MKETVRQRLSETGDANTAHKVKSWYLRQLAQTAGAVVTAE